MRSADAHDHAPEHAPAAEHVPDAPARLPRTLARKATTASPAIVTHPDTAWSFGDAVNAGVHVARAAADGDITHGAEAAVGRAAASSGSSLPVSLQRKFESSLGVDLSDVRVHTGAASAEATSAVAARAYATGQDIHFNAGQYDPSSPAGEHLIAHEVAHTVQQRGGSTGAQFKLEVTGPGDSCEHEADAAADAMVAGRPFDVGGAGPAVARDPALTPEQEHVLQIVQAQGVGLGARDEATIVHHANVLQQALNTQHGPMRQRIARALVTLYDAMDANLRRRFDAGEDVGMAFEIVPFSMIDIWVADASERSRPRHRRPHRRRPEPVADRGVTGDGGGGGGGGGAPDVAGRVTDATRGVAMEMPHGDHSGHTMHTIGTVAEVTHTVIDLALLSQTIEHALLARFGAAALFGLELFGLAAGAIGTVATAAAVVHTGDEFNRLGGELQPRIVHFCAAFARTLRGEGAGGGDGASQGAAAAQPVIANLAAQHITTAQIAQAMHFGRIYHMVWQRVAPDLRRRLSDFGEGAVPNNEGFAAGWIDPTILDGSAYSRYVGR